MRAAAVQAREAGEIPWPAAPSSRALAGYALDPASWAVSWTAATSGPSPGRRRPRSPRWPAVPLSPRLGQRRPSSRSLAGGSLQPAS
jgi:hypothetical protein